LRERFRASLIVTLQRANAAPDRLGRLVEWVRNLHAKGLQHVRLHLMESENDIIRAEYALSAEENIAALLRFLALERELPGLSLDLFKDMRMMLRGDDRRTTCIWKGCDPYTTRAVRGIEGNGQRSNCGRTNKEGIEFVKSDREGFERTLMLYETPQEHGGCQGCRFFLMCRGNCPGTALEGDWRNRTEHCKVWKALFTELEEEISQAGETPLSRSDLRIPLEEAMRSAWRSGRNPSMPRVMQDMLAPGEESDWRSELEALRAEMAAALTSARPRSSRETTSVSAP
jgi:uncharacterized protein